MGGGGDMSLLASFDAIIEFDVSVIITFRSDQSARSCRNKKNVPDPTEELNRW